jgi:hypothetical protein
MTGDGAHLEASRDKFTDDGTADRAEPGDNVEFRLGHDRPARRSASSRHSHEPHSLTGSA